MSTKVFISGCTGRMGQNIIKLISEDSDTWSYAGGLTNKPAADNETADLSTVDASQVDIVIDFSLPEAHTKALNWAIENKKPMVSGTTGLTEEHFKKINQASEVIPILWAANTSLGVNVVNELLPSLSALKDFDVQIVEAHHNKKLDAPSGTAILLQNSITNSWKPDAPEPLSVRGGGIYGEHEVRIMSDEEVIEIKHTALTRAVFAKGALYAAKFLLSKSPGLYTMSDVIKG